MNDEAEKDKLTDTVSLELDTDLRLNPKQLQLGKVELLTDALILPYSNIEKQLSQFVTGASQDETKRLRRKMKNYLDRLNANPLIPLNFRMKVLNQFEQELELFDAEMTAAVLNAHKIGVDLVQKAAREESGYYTYLIDMVSNAIELAVKLLLLSLAQHRAPAVISTRQFFDLARLGLNVARVLDKRSHARQQRLYKAVCNYELLRALNFYGKTETQQKMTWEELQYHIGVLQPQFYRDGESPGEMANKSFLVSNINRPNEPARFFNSLPDPLRHACIVIPMDAFMNRLDTALKRVKSVLENQDIQKKSLHTEDSLQTTLVGGSAILYALRNEKREDRSSDQPKAHVILEWDAARAFNSVFSSAAAWWGESDTADTSAWSVIHISNHGVDVERISSEPLPYHIGSFVGLKWIPDAKQPTLGFISWFKEVKPGECHIRIHFLKDQCQLAQATIYAGDEALHSKRTWPILVKPGKSSIITIFPDPHIARKMVFVISRNDKNAYFKVKEVITSGPNATVCQMVRAKLTNAAK